MALKWLFSLSQKSKRTLPNVYLSPGDSSLIVTPEFDYPLPSFPFSETALRHDDKLKVTSKHPHSRTHYPDPVHGRTLSDQVHRDDAALSTIDFMDSLSNDSDAHSPLSSHDILHSSHGPIIRRSTTTRSKLKKTRRKVNQHPAHIYDPSLHWPTSVASNTSSTSNSLHDLSLLSVPARGAIGNRFKVDPKSFYSSPSSPALSTFALSATSEGLPSRSTTSGGGGTSRSCSDLARKLTKRKRPPPLPSPDSSPTQSNRVASNKPSPGITSSAAAGAPSQPQANRRVLTAASVAADYARFWNLSAPDLPASGRTAHTRHPSISAPTPPPKPHQRASSYVIPKPVPGPSPLRGRPDARLLDHREKMKDFSSSPQKANRSTNDPLVHVTEPAGCGDDHDIFTKQRWLEKYRENGEHSFPLSTPASSTTFSLYGFNDIGENKSAWRSTWSVEETIPGDMSGTGPITASMSTTALDNPSDFAEKSSSARGQVHPPKRPEIVWRNVDDSLRRRWTVANAVTDEEITDEALIEQLERLRRRGDSEKANVYGGPQARLQHARRRFSKHRAIPSPSRWFGVSDGPMWHTARLALLTCRELVRTERSYLTQICLMLDGNNTSTPIPGLVTTYVPALVQASEMLLKHMLEDPSAWGISSAFVKCEEALESAFVGWCGIVGMLLVKQGENGGVVGVSDSGGEGTERNNVPSTGAREMVNGRRRRNSTSAVPSSTTTKSFTPSHPFSMLLTGTKSYGKDAEGLKQSGKPSLRELAILPTQRIMRYVLLYRGLLEHTPSPPSSRNMVEDAVKVATKIAQKCDRAQDNAEFLMH